MSTPPDTPLDLDLSLRDRLRHMGLSRREALSEPVRCSLSERACSHLIADLKQSIRDFSQVVLALYWPIRSEMDPRSVGRFITAHGGSLALPVILDHNTMIFRLFSEEASLKPMRFGTLGPDATHSVVHPTLILVPVLAFDRHYHRLGYGRGYYDQAVQKLTQCGHSVSLFGLGFSCQEVDFIPPTKRDLVLQKMFTEEGLLKCAAA